MYVRKILMRNTRFLDAKSLETMPESLLAYRQIASIWALYQKFSLSQEDNKMPPNFTVTIHSPMLAVIFDSIKIKRILLFIKSSLGCDNIHPKILKNLADDLAISLAVIFTSSYNSSSFSIPNAWKSSYIYPI